MKKNPLEWSVFGVSSALLVMLVGYLGLLAIRVQGKEAAFRLRLGTPERVEKGYRTRVTVENISDATTRGVKAEVGEAEVEFDYVPRHSEREGFVVTDEPPEEGRVVAWQAP